MDANTGLNPVRRIPAIFIDVPKPAQQSSLHKRAPRYASDSDDTLSIVKTEINDDSDSSDDSEAMITSVTLGNHTLSLETTRVLEAVHNTVFRCLGFHEFNGKIFSTLNETQKFIAIEFLQAKVKDSVLEKLITSTEDTTKLSETDFIDLGELRIYSNKKGKPVRKDQWYKLAFSPALRIVRRAYMSHKHAKDPSIRLNKKEIDRAVFKHYFKRESERILEMPGLHRNTEAEALFFVKHGVTSAWFKLARDWDRPNGSLAFYEELKKVLDSPMLQEFYRRRIGRMLGGLMGLQPHASLLNKTPDEALEEVKKRLTTGGKMPKMPMAMSQFRQCVVLAKQLMKKHTKEEDELRAKRRELRLIRKERYESRAPQPL